MNLGQVLNENGGVNEEIELPTFSVLALEARRHPTFRPGDLFRNYTVSDDVIAARTAQTARAASEGEKPASGVVESILKVARAATANGQKLSSTELFERAGIKSSGSTLKALRNLRKKGYVQSEGRTRGLVYWVNSSEEKCTTEIAAASS